MSEIDTAEIPHTPPIDTDKERKLPCSGAQRERLCDEIDRLRAKVTNQDQVISELLVRHIPLEKALAEAIDGRATARADALEEAAKVAKGRPVETGYREWPGVDSWVGNLASGNKTTQHCDAIAVAILALASSGGEKGEANG